MSDPLDLPVIKARAQRREAIRGPREGDWVILPDGSCVRLSTDGIREMNSWVRSSEKWPIDSIPDRENSHRVDHPCFATDGSEGSFYLERDGRSQHSGVNVFHNVSRRAQLSDTGQTQNATFHAFEMGHPILGRGVSFELPCRVYRLDEAQGPTTRIGNGQDCVATFGDFR
jgi:hypothetical protein